MMYLLFSFEIALCLRVHTRFHLIPFRVSAELVAPVAPRIAELGGNRRPINVLRLPLRPLGLPGDQQLQDVLRLRFTPL